MYLGYHKNISKQKFRKALKMFSYDITTKRACYNSAVKYANEIRDGQKIVKETINEVLAR